jgi:ABC-2 type transport system permease protein
MLFSMSGSSDSGMSASFRMASFVIYGVIGVAFFQFGVSIAQERESNWERYRRTLPNAFGPHMASKIISALVFVLLTAAPVIGVALILSEPIISPEKIIALLLAYLGGLWMPLDRLPAGIANLSQFTPTRHAGEIGWAIVGGHQVPASSIIWLVGFSVAFAIFAYWRYQRDERKRYA